MRSRSSAQFSIQQSVERLAANGSVQRPYFGGNERERGRFTRVAAIKVADQRRVQNSLARKRRPIGINPATKRTHHLAYMLPDDKLHAAKLAPLPLHFVAEHLRQTTLRLPTRTPPPSPA